MLSIEKALSKNSGAKGISIVFAIISCEKVLLAHAIFEFPLR